MTFVLVICVIEFECRQIKHVYLCLIWVCARFFIFSLFEVEGFDFVFGLVLTIVFDKLWLPS